MRFRAVRKLDENHLPMVAFFVGAGCSVLDLSAVGSGCPDVLVARNGNDCMVEFKRPGWKPTNSPRERLTAEKQARWANHWRGCPVRRVQSVSDAQAVLALLARPTANA